MRAGARDLATHAHRVTSTAAGRVGRAPPGDASLSGGLKIVVYGPPLAGKLTLLRTFGRHHGLTARRIQLPTGLPDLKSPGVLLDVPLGRDGCVLATASGQPWGAAPWLALLTGAQAVILVLDCQEQAPVQAEQVFRDLEALGGSHLVIACVLTKLDIVLAPRVEEVRSIARARLAPTVPILEAQPEPLNLVEALQSLLYRLAATATG